MSSQSLNHDLSAQTPSHRDRAQPPTRACGLLTGIFGLAPYFSPSIVVAQLLFSTAAWVFVSALAYHRQLPLPDSAAQIISQYRSATTLLVTLIATTISALSSFFFTRAIGRALTSRLRRPLSLGRLRTGIELSKGSFILDSKWPFLTIATIVCVVILNTLTAAWATLLTPLYIVVDVGMTGQMLDLSSLHTLETSGSLQLEPYPGPTETSPLAWIFGSDVTPPIDVSQALSWGTSAALGALGVPSIQTVQLFGPPMFNVSTGGVFPAVLSDVTGIVGGAAVPVHVTSDTPYPRGLSRNYTIVQQGFTVDVECRSQNFSGIGAGFPSMTLSSAPLPLPPLSQSQSNSTPLVSWAWTTNCTAYSSSYVGSILVSNAKDPAKVLAGAVCPFQDFSGPSNQSALVLIQSVNGSYHDGPSELAMVCEVTPLITRLSVDYGGTTANVSSVVTKTRLSADGSNWPLLFGPAKTLAMILYSSQGMTDNFIMNSINYTMTTLTGPSNNVTTQTQLMVESYLRGMVEYWATMHRSMLYLGASFTDEMVLQTDGTMHITTIGWKYNESTYLLALVPISIIMGLTLCAVAIDYYEKRGVHRSSGAPVDVAHQSFNPSNAMHVILASGSGGLHQALEAGRHVTDYGSLQVRLGVRDGVAVLMKEGSSPVENVQTTASTDQITATPGSEHPESAVRPTSSVLVDGKREDRE
ncbi:hypothetical protein PAXRUDRAFT_833651 [Paxillus rubicundulus Ve08.2h10]|uniref:Unplaced genomic scaffold scaffold_1241, whole genome shotgun sequence n=1 Tax=Paxillus rubicundulus Ve08.2h10 TaxID=930991 RepID=A0A0D0DG95_9AGAM|nr:hypothetical protein PAXRUDRAFT_833651 [Paxillus rubicundulus Ve08.2h10]